MEMARIRTTAGLAVLCFFVAVPCVARPAAPSVGVPDAPAPGEPSDARSKSVGVPDAPVRVKTSATVSRSIGVPDAPGPVETTLARKDFAFPSGFTTTAGRQFPAGYYELALIESAGRYYLQLTHRETKEGIRVVAHNGGPPPAEAADAHGVSVSQEEDRESLQFTCGEVTATFPVYHPRTTS